MRKNSVIFITLISLFFFSCSGFNYSQLIAMPIQMGIEVGIPELIDKSLSEDKNARQTWLLVQESIDNQLLPLLKGESPKVGDIDTWMNVTQSKAPKYVKQALEKWGNRLLRILLPPGTTQYKGNDPIIKDIIGIVIDCAITLRDTIAEKLEKPLSRSFFLK